MWPEGRVSRNDMRDIDERYQRVVDELAKEFLELSLDELLHRPRHGRVQRSTGKETINVGVEHETYSDEEHHIWFCAQRQVLLIAYRKYINGVVFGRNSPPRLMTDEESGRYD